MAHELKTPLSSIIGHMETLQQSWNTPWASRFLINEVIHRLVRLNQLLLQDVLLLEPDGTWSPNYGNGTVCINKIVENVTDDLEISSWKKNITVDTSFMEMYIEAIKCFIFIFRNLMDNSTLAYGGENIKFSSPNEWGKIFLFHFLTMVWVVLNIYHHCLIVSTG